MMNTSAAQPPPPHPTVNVKPDPSTQNHSQFQLNLGEAVDRILMAVEARQAAADSSSADVFDHTVVGMASIPGGTGKSNCQSPANIKFGCDGGPLTAQEVSHLGILCASISTNHDTAMMVSSSSAIEGSPARTVSNDIALAASDDNTVPLTSESFRKGAWADVDGDSLAALMPMLEAHVVSASCIDLISDVHTEIENGGTVDEWLNPRLPCGQGFQRVSILRRGLEAASVLLSVMTCPGVDRRSVSDDGIEACISLMRQHLHKNVIPALTNTGHTGSSPVPNTNMNSPPPTKKRKTKMTEGGKKKEQAMTRSMKKLYRPILTTVGLLNLLIERVETLVRCVQLDDQPLLSISSAALSTLAMDPSSSSQGGNAALCHLIQISSVGLVSAVFHRYPRHRTIIIEDLFPLMLRLPTSKRSMRTFPVRCTSTGDSSLQLNRRQSSTSTTSPFSPSPATATSNEQQTCIQIVTALILNLVQGCVVMPLAVEGDQSNDKQAAAEETSRLPRLSSGLQECHSICEFFAIQMLQRCSRKGEEGGASEFRPVLANLIDDLLFVQLSPEYPASEMLLLTFCRRLSHDLLRSSSVNKKNGNKPVPAEPTYLATAMDTLGKICAKIAGHIASHRENPLKFPEAVDRRDVDEMADPASNSNEVNRCFCGRTGLNDTFMLDCDRCHAWFHGSCVGITKDTLPEVWICDECIMNIAVLEQTKAFAERFSRNRKQLQSKKKKDPQDAPFPEVEKSHVFRQLLLNYLTNLAEKARAPAFKVAREFHIAKWVQELELLRWSSSNNECENNMKGSELMCAHFLDQWCLSAAASVTEDANSRKGQGNGNVAAESVKSLMQRQRQHHYLSEEGTVKILQTLSATRSELANSFPRLLGVLVELMGDDDLVSLRKLAVKAIGQVVQVDPLLMLQPTVRSAVAHRFHDEAISVREAAVSLVGSYVLQVPMVANAFHLSLLACLKDSGVSVRKRAVKIFRDVLVSNPSYQGRASACTVMLQRAADRKEDDGVRDLIHETFQTLWFDSGVDEDLKCSSKFPQSVADIDGEGGVLANACSIAAVSTSNQNASAISPDPTGNNGKGGAARRRTKNADIVAGQCHARCHATASQMVEVVASSGNAESLTCLMKELLFGLGEGDKESKAAERRRKQKAAQSQCATLVASLFEQLLSFEESRVPTNDVNAGRKLVALIETLSVFAEASPTLLVQHLDTLLPYLKADNGVSRENEGSIITSVCNIVSRVAPILTSGDIQRLSEGAVGDDLIKITYTFGSVPSCAAVEALARLANHKDAGEGNSPRTKLMKLASTFYSYLFKTKDSTDDFSSVKVKVKNNVHRALSVLGSICRFHSNGNSVDINDDDPRNFPIIRPQELDWSNLSNASYTVFVSFLSKNDISTKCAALRAMGGIFVARPRFMLAVQQTGVISQVMSNESDPDLQLEALNCWRTILLSEERRIESGEAKEQMDSKEDITVSKRISGDQDGDSSLVGGVLSQHSLRLFEMTKSSNERIRYGSVDLIGHLLRQGLINPMETVPHLLALQGDVGAPSIRALALKLLVTEGEKRPDMLRQRVCAGIKQAYLFQRAVYPSLPATALIQVERNGDGGTGVECIFGQIFKESIRSSRVQRQGLSRSLLSLFGNDEVLDEKSGISGKKMSKSLVGQMPLLSFAAQVLAHLPYNTLNDPLFIIYHISCATALEGAQLLDRFAAFLSSQGFSVDEYDADINCEDELEKAAKAKNPSKTKAAAAIHNCNFDASRFIELCAKAASLVLLLRLKHFLRRVYNLSETRCMEYLPSDKERLGDKGVSFLDKMPIFNATVESLFKTKTSNAKNASKDSKDIDKDAAIRQYAEFRQLMRSQEASTMVKEDGDEVTGGRVGQNRGKKRKASQFEESDDSSSDDEYQRL